MQIIIYREKTFYVLFCFTAQAMYLVGKDYNVSWERKPLLHQEHTSVVSWVFSILNQLSFFFFLPFSFFYFLSLFLFSSISYLLWEQVLHCGAIWLGFGLMVVLYRVRGKAEGSYLQETRIYICIVLPTRCDTLLYALDLTFVFSRDIFFLSLFQFFFFQFAYFLTRKKVWKEKKYDDKFSLAFRTHFLFVVSSLLSFQLTTATFVYISTE